VKHHKNEFAVKIPWVLGLITTRSIDRSVPGIDELVGLAKQRIESGMIAYDALDRLRVDRGNAALQKLFDAHVADLGMPCC
jgi:cytochrome d ubiquinol oxidase subunit I